MFPKQESSLHRRALSPLTIQNCTFPSVLYFSWHRYEHQSFWPNLRESDFDSVGSGKGAGFNVNVPWNQVTHI